MGIVGGAKRTELKHEPGTTTRRLRARKSSAACVHRSGEPIREETCKVCNNKSKEVPVYHCNKYDTECMTHRYVNMRACSNCPSYSTKTEEPGPS